MTLLGLLKRRPKIDKRRCRDAHGLATTLACCLHRESRTGWRCREDGRRRGRENRVYCCRCDFDGGWRLG